MDKKPGLSWYHVSLQFLMFTGLPSNEANDNDGLSTAAAVAITAVVTFFMTLVTTLISVIITNLYFRYRYEKRSKHSRSLGDRTPDEKEASVPRDDPYISTGTTIKMENNPAYATTNY